MNTKTKSTPSKSDNGTWETMKIVLQALAIALVIRTFFFQPFTIPSGSMIPTLKIGDYLFVNKLSYGYGPYSFNLNLSVFGTQLIKIGPFDSFRGRVFADYPERGDVVVFKFPRDNETDYIKRTIGLPGDTIRVTQGVLHVNGVPVKRTRIDDYLDSDYGDRAIPIPQFRETLKNGVVFDTLDTSPNSNADNTQEFRVPAGHYFMMGDNRDNSTDSRFPQVGFVPYDNLVGKATIVFFSRRKDASIWKFWQWPFKIRWERFFTWLS